MFKINPDLFHKKSNTAMLIFMCIHPSTRGTANSAASMEVNGSVVSCPIIKSLPCLRPKLELQLHLKVYQVLPHLESHTFIWCITVCWDILFMCALHSFCFFRHIESDTIILFTFGWSHFWHRLLDCLSLIISISISRFRKISPGHLQHTSNGANKKLGS